jgi:hypothetical protein
LSLGLDRRHQFRLAKRFKLVFFCTIFNFSVSLLWFNGHNLFGYRSYKFVFGVLRFFFKTWITANQSTFFNWNAFYVNFIFLIFFTVVLLKNLIKLNFIAFILSRHFRTRRRAPLFFILKINRGLLHKNIRLL